jgi:hypothetical protein
LPSFAFQGIAAANDDVVDDGEDEDELEIDEED